MSLSWIRSRCVAGLIIATSWLTACGGGGDAHVAPTIVQAAQSDARFTILVEAVQAADPAVGAALSGSGPLTVFAPTNDAFVSLLSELGITKAQLLSNQALVTQVLRYHVLPAKVLKAQVPLGRAVSPLSGGIFKVDTVGADLIITDGRNRKPRIVATDIETGNGVIHAVDKVLLPADKTLVQTVQSLASAAAPQFTTLLAAVQVADPSVAAALGGSGPFTVFAPTDAAFRALLSELNVTPAQLLASPALLTQVLKYHVVQARVLKAEVPVGVPIATVQGGAITVNAGFGITDARGRVSTITATDTLAANGVIHVIDRVLLPSP